MILFAINTRTSSFIVTLISNIIWLTSIAKLIVLINIDHKTVVCEIKPNSRISKYTASPNYATNSQYNYSCPHVKTMNTLELTNSKQ